MHCAASPGATCKAVYIVRRSLYKHSAARAGAKELPRSRSSTAASQPTTTRPMHMPICHTSKCKKNSFTAYTGVASSTKNRLFVGNRRVSRNPAAVNSAENSASVRSFASPYCTIMWTSPHVRGVWVVVIASFAMHASTIARRQPALLPMAARICMCTVGCGCVIDHSQCNNAHISTTGCCSSARGSVSMHVHRQPHAQPAKALTAFRMRSASASPQS